jgi:hypothetical protein
LWAALRELTGGQFIAANLEMQLAEQWGLPPLAASAFVVQSPIRGMVLQDAGKPSPNLVWAVRLKSGAELETLLTKGSQATFTSERLPSGETLLNPKQPAVSRQLAVLGNALLVAPSREPLLLASRYLTQTFAASSSRTGPAPYFEVTFNQRGLQGLSEPLRQAWQTQRANLALLLDQQMTAKGRPADYADPANVLQLIGQQMQETLDVVAGLSRVAIRLNEQQGNLVLEMTLEATGSGATQKWLSGFAQSQSPPWAQLSHQARALLSHSFTASPDFGKRVAQQLAGVFAERLTAADLERIEKAFTALGNGLGSSCTWGWLKVGENGAVFLVTRVRDGASFKEGLKGVLELNTVPALSKITAELLDGARLTPVKIDIAGDAVEGYRWQRAASSRARLGAAALGMGAMESSVLWAVHGELGYLVVGPASEVALRDLLMPAQTLGDQAELQPILGQGHTVPSTAVLGYGNAPGAGGVVAFGSITATKAGAELRLQVNRAMIQSALPWLGLLLIAP